MNILLVHCHYRLAGGEDAVFEDERRMLERHGHTVTVLESTNDVSGASKALLPLAALYNPAAAAQVRRLIRERDIHLVHVHNTLLRLSPAVLRAAKAAGVPVVQTLHNFRLFCPNGVLLRQGRVCEDCPRQGAACAVRHACYRDSQPLSALVAAVYGLHRAAGTFRGVTLLTPTEFDRRKLVEFNRLRPTFDEDRLFVKANPVTIADPGEVPVKNQLLYAGRLEELKGLRTVLEAWKLLGDAAPRLVVAGNGPLEGWARDNATPQVEFVGRLTRAGLHHAMAESRAVVAASLCYESFALVPAEAHALGVPVLASDLGNVGDAVTEGFNGLHFAPGDAAALAQAVRRLDTVRFDRTSIRAEAAIRISPEENYQTLMQIYRAAGANPERRAGP